MLAGQYALLPENKAGFWVDKMFVDGRLIYIVFHQGMAEFCDSISDAKQRLRDRRRDYVEANRAKIGLKPMTRSVSIISSRVL